ncbi:MAG: HD domain-containing protein [Candidatus Thorarchaeota archaeon]
MRLQNIASTMEQIENFVRQELIQAGRGAHALDHTNRVYALCMRIGAELDANLRVLGAAALLHDVGRPRENETGVSHSILSGEMGRGVLSETGFTDEEIDQVVDAIRTHRFSEDLEPNSLEGRILSDVDKLDAIGAIGVFRAIAQATSGGGGIESFLKHANEKLLKLKDLIYTEPSRVEAEKRHKILEAFVNQLRSELK